MIECNVKDSQSLLCPRFILVFPIVVWSQSNKRQIRVMHRCAVLSTNHPECQITTWPLTWMTTIKYLQYTSSTIDKGMLKDLKKTHRAYGRVSWRQTMCHSHKNTFITQHARFFPSQHIPVSAQCAKQFPRRTNPADGKPWVYSINRQIRLVNLVAFDDHALKPN